MKATSQRAQLPGLKVKKFISYGHLKTRKHTVSIELSYSDFSSFFFLFIEILIDNLLMQFILYSKL